MCNRAQIINELNQNIRKQAANTKEHQVVRLVFYYVEEECEKDKAEYSKKDGFVTHKDLRNR